MAGTTLGAQINSGLLVIREPKIAALTAGNILQEYLIEMLNSAVDELANRYEFDWAIKRTPLTFVAELTTGTVGVTNGSTTVTASAEQFTNVSANEQWFRRTSDTTSYLITAVDTGASPDECTLESAYVGTTSSAAGYSIFQDEYAITASDFDDIRSISYGDAGYAQASLSGHSPERQIFYRKLADLMRDSGGDLHRNTAGRPSMCCRMGVNSSDQPIFKFWPAPRYQHLIHIYYQPKYSSLSTFDSAVFGSDAPQVAYMALEHYMRHAACLYDKQTDEARGWENKWNQAVALMLRRENDESIDRSFRVASYRQSYTTTVRAQSGIYFDTRGAQR